jgi:hypothetical protein
MVAVTPCCHDDDVARTVRPGEKWKRFWRHEDTVVRRAETKRRRRREHQDLHVEREPKKPRRTSGWLTW